MNSPAANANSWSLAPAPQLDLLIDPATAVSGFTGFQPVLQSLCVRLRFASNRALAMPALSVTLLSGKPIVELGDFLGNGAELRERVAFELHISPERVKLLAGSREIVNEETLAETEDAVTAMVAEGQELPEWCEEKMPGYSFKEVPGVGSLPQGSEDIDAKLLGRVFMLALKRFMNNTQRKYRKSVQVLFGVAMDRYQSDASPEAWARRRLANAADLPKWQELFLQKKADVVRCKEAISKFVALDHRLQGSSAVRCYSRWESHEVDGVQGRHRVYGLRQAYSAVEFDKVLGMWIEGEGCLDRQASISILGLWTWTGMPQSWMGLREPRWWADQRDIRRECSTEEAAERFETFIRLISAAQMRREAAWLVPHVDQAIWAVLLGFHIEAVLLSETAFSAEAGKKEACMAILGRALRAMLRMPAHEDGMRDKVFEAVLDMADHRNDAVRIYGLQLLSEHFAADKRAAALLEHRSAADWPHMHTYVEAAREACVAGSPSSLLPSNEVPDKLPSPRRLVNQKLLDNPVCLTGDRQPGYIRRFSMLF